MTARGIALALAAAAAIGTGGGGAARVSAATCAGDCNGDGAVAINELITGVTIALGAPLATCRAFDRSGDQAVTVEELIAAVNNALAGCQAPPTPTATPGSPTHTPTVTPTMSTTLELFDVGANFFSIRKPKGWEVHLGGVCSTLGILLRDPAVPMRQAFYFGLIGPVYLKEAQRQIDQAYIDGGGYNFITWLDAPAVDPLTAGNFFIHWPQIAQMKAATEFLPEFPRLTGLTAVTTTPQSSVFPGGDAALVRGLFTDGDAVGQGQWLGTTWVFMPFTGVPGGGTAYGSIILGVTAPMREFKQVEATLIASLDSFTVTQAYIDWCRLQSSQLWGAVAKAGRTLSETSDLIVDGWQSRTQQSDILAEQYSDGLRSVERVYDPSTHQVYEVPLGWFDAYDGHRGDYALDDLQRLPDDNYDLWTSVPADGALIH